MSSGGDDRHGPIAWRLRRPQVQCERACINTRRDRKNADVHRHRRRVAFALAAAESFDHEARHQQSDLADRG